MVLSPFELLQQSRGHVELSMVLIQESITQVPKPFLTIYIAFIHHLLFALTLAFVGNHTATAIENSVLYN